MYLHKEYQTINVNGKDQEIKFTVTFNRDQTNWATNQPKKIGYQVTATPIERIKREGGYTVESFGAFTGFNDSLLEVSRQSKNRLQTALDTLAERKEMYLNHFKKQLNGTKENNTI